MTSYLSLSSTDFSLLNPIYSVYSYLSNSISYYLGYQSSNKLLELPISNIQELQKDNIVIQDKKINKLNNKPNNGINKLTKSIFSPVSSIQKNISNKLKNRLKNSLKNNMEYKYKKDIHVLEKYPKKIQFRTKIKRIQQPNIITNLKRNVPMIRQ